jgi:cobyrinic acid a,c-diamide synthase
MPHLYIAAAHKSSGKTTVSVGLSAALRRQGQIVQPFKKGPDYIDPLWLSRAAGRPCYNLDFFTQGHAEILRLFTSRQGTDGIGIIEGNKGLFDGVDVHGSDSNAALACLLHAPVVLVIDTGGMTRGIAPLIRGYLDFDDTVNIAGVILNKVGGSRHEAKLRTALELYTDTEVLGAIGRDPALEIPERHLGLIPANETADPRGVDSKIARLADAVSAGTDINRIIGIASSAPLPAMEKSRAYAATTVEPDIRVAIARDAAFGFYYQDDLETFERLGATLVPFDALSDAHLPEADALFIGGGFPETHISALAGNQSLRNDIQRALRNGMPAYAECGGLMYLSRKIQWRGESGDMVGFVPADTVVGKRPQGRGYMLISETADNPWPGAADMAAPAARIPVHEFHYARLENLDGAARFAQRVLRGAGIDGKHDGLVINNLVAGFAHQRHTAANPWIERFLGFVRQVKSGRGL